VLLDEVIGIAARQVKTRFGAAQSYDYLVPATGSQTPGSAAQMTAPALGRGTAVEQSAMRRISADR